MTLPMGPFVGVVETVCGLLIVLGLYTRLAAIPLIIIMLVRLGWLGTSWRAPDTSCASAMSVFGTFRTSAERATFASKYDDLARYACNTLSQGPYAYYKQKVQSEWRDLITGRKRSCFP